MAIFGLMCSGIPVTSVGLMPLEQGIDEGRDGATREQHQGGDQQEQHDDRRKPPLLVVLDEVEELADDAGLAAVGLPLEFVGLLVWVVVAHKEMSKLAEITLGVGIVSGPGDPVTC